MGSKDKKDLEEIEIQLDGDTPLSKKELRRIKKGKITLEEIQKKKAKKLAKAAASGNESKVSNESGESSESKESKESKDETTTTKRSDYGIWMGNLSFDTTRDEVSNFITSKSIPKIDKKEIARINLPTRGTKNKGFAYIDFFTEENLNSALKLTELELNGRKVLIKNSKSFEGRPEKSIGLTKTLSQNPPSRILFVGNLSFDTTSDLLKDHFKHCGEILKIRMATFEDTGKCKGFAFIDFKDLDGPTNALKDKSCKKLINRPLRLEFGEDRSQRKVIPKRSFDEINDNNDSTPTEYNNVQPNRGFQEKQDKSSFKRQQFNKPDQRMNSGIALANAQRQSAAIVKSTGKKVTFD